jgi:exonuclease III
MRGAAHDAARERAGEHGVSALSLRATTSCRPISTSTHRSAGFDDALFRPEVRDAYRRLVAQGWTDALRTQHPGERIYTFWKYFRNAFGRNAGLRIDHLLLSLPFAKRLTSAGVDRDVRGCENASDHAPAWIELAEPAKASPGRARRLKTAS